MFQICKMMKSAMLLIVGIMQSVATNLKNDFAILEQEFHKENYFTINKTIQVMVEVQTSVSSTIENSVDETKVYSNNNCSVIIGLEVNEEELYSLKTDPSVIRIERNHEMSILDEINGRKLGEFLEWNANLVMQDYSFFREKYPEGFVKVCIADTGYAYGHDDLPKIPYVNGTDAVGESWMYDGNGHGTHVAGIIAALGGNGKGVYGIIPHEYDGKFQLIISKAFDSSGKGSQISTIAAVNHCVEKGANVISLSLGCRDCYSVIEENYYQSLVDQNILIFAASGNDGSSKYSYPASYNSVISIASITSDFQRSPFSQYNNQVELTAPGSNIRSTWPGNSYIIQSGTSMATPHVAAVAGLLWMFFPQCTNTQIRNVLAFTAMDLDVEGCDFNTGFGSIQAKDAFDRLALGDCGSLEGSPLGGCYNIVEKEYHIVTRAPTRKKPKKKNKKKNKKKIIIRTKSKRRQKKVTKT